MRRDRIHPGVIRELAEELTKLLSIIDQQPWLSGVVPDDWKLASVMPIQKTGQKEDPRNYRPVSLTLVTILVDEGKAVYVVYLDFSKAFATVSHDMLLAGWPGRESAGEWGCIQLVAGHQWCPPGIGVGPSSV
ncbi:hypothetical protein WISP_102501 [Willisornis vidua]|uniref:Reverse transcriptase domain-containing protein n=1 Tax=Willisornis vidua TaxID=1566151 RepID=A0ABQ9CY20_9PASS|nr:hypothetical protein WISP_102501 [Willisornis vidua]